MTLTRTLAWPFAWLLDKTAGALASLRVPPYLITWLCLFLNFWAAALFAFGRFAAAGGMMLLAGACDLLDGPVAAKQGRVSVIETFLDSILDSYADLILFLGLLVYYAQVNRFLNAGLVGAAMAGAVMVSYSRARAESLIPRCDVGFWERPERIALMILGALTNRMTWVLWVLAIGPNITVVHRIIYTWRRTEGAARTSSQQPAHPESPAMPDTPLLSRTARHSG